ncbi:vacuolar protein sorting-associated protein 37C-like isoform X2 [Mercenaria mercenaria]|uniref:vacuolar protein sorting-associated protein 37C-like isoform X2 n=1 Tax=Mercenaria mercenaria TaxID=6596 RepID=UPI001E1D65E3|nr:vacuolar protein sorting-associated protein 37C-like isoform X2 [Mercenaria mercenaria]
MYREFHRHESESNMRLEAPKLRMDENAATTLLQYMTKEQLQEFIDNPEKVDTHIADLEQTKVIQKDRENIIVKNKSLAEYNISLQPHFENLKRNVATAYEEVNALKMALCTDVAKLESAPGCQPHDTLLAIYQTEAADADDNSEEIAENFLDGKMDIDSFLSKYIPKRSEAFTKKAKLEKVGELFRQFGSTNSAPYPTNTSSHDTYNKPHTSNVAPPAYGGAGYGMSNRPPYPAPGGPYGGSGMPMASYYQR